MKAGGECVSCLLCDCRGSCVLDCVVFAGKAAKRPFDRSTTGSRLDRFAHSACRQALNRPSLPTGQGASTDFPPQSVADDLPRQTAIRCRAAQSRPFPDSVPDIAALSATFTDTHPKHSSISFSATPQGRTQESPNLHFPRVREDGLRAAWRN